MRRNWNVEVGDDDLDPVVALVQIIVNVRFADEIPVLADLWKQFEYPLDDCEYKWFFNLVEFTPDFFERMVDLDPLLDGLNLKEEQIKCPPLKKFSRDKSLVDIDDLIAVVEDNVQKIEYFDDFLPIKIVLFLDVRPQDLLEDTID